MYKLDNIVYSHLKMCHICTKMAVYNYIFINQKLNYFMTLYLVMNRVGNDNLTYSVHQLLN